MGFLTLGQVEEYSPPRSPLSLGVGLVAKG